MYSQRTLKQVLAKVLEGSHWKLLFHGGWPRREKDRQQKLDASPPALRYESIAAIPSSCLRWCGKGEMALAADDHGRQETAVTIANTAASFRNAPPRAGRKLSLSAALRRSSRRILHTIPHAGGATGKIRGIWQAFGVDLERPSCPGCPCYFWNLDRHINLRWVELTKSLYDVQECYGLNNLTPLFYRTTWLAKYVNLWLALSLLQTIRVLSYLRRGGHPALLLCPRWPVENVPVPRIWAVLTTTDPTPSTKMFSTRFTAFIVASVATLAVVNGTPQVSKAAVPAPDVHGIEVEACAQTNYQDCLAHHFSAGQCIALPANLVNHLNSLVVPDGWECTIFGPAAGCDPATVPSTTVFPPGAPNLALQKFNDTAKSVKCRQI
ncbi:hypothetical protein FB451DRAFT_1168987 [Mycena latifolia]|nr:hypothetical protein FB451DRAFT_1168987 [Mycena latifolia]